MNAPRENMFHPATNKDYPKKRIHQTAILCYCDEVGSIEPYHIWVTATPRAKQSIQISLYVGDESTNPQRRECLDTVIVSSWSQTVDWFKRLNEISEDRFDEIPDDEVASYKPVFSKLRPSWF